MVENKISEFNLWEFGPLVSSKFFIDPDFAGALVRVDLLFSNKRLYIMVNEEDDSIIFNDKVTLEKRDACLLQESSELKQLFSSLQGWTLLWMWELTNQQGYTDAIQLEFMSKKVGCEGNAHVIYQFVAMASTIKVYLLKSIT